MQNKLSNFQGYCSKYKVRNAKKILDAFNATKPELQRLPKEFEWQKEGHMGFIFQGERKFKIIVDPSRDNWVTFVGIEGVNWDGKS